MTDDLMSRIEKYDNRTRKIYARRRAEEEAAEREEKYALELEEAAAWEERYGRAAEEAQEEADWTEEPEKEPEEDLPEEKLPAEGPAAPETIPAEVFFDADEEIIGGSPWGPLSLNLYHNNRFRVYEGFCAAAGRYPEHLRYIVSPDNPWYFDIDGVVYSKETGLLVLFPLGREEYTIPEDDRITGIGDMAFVGAGLKRIILNDRIRWIGHYAFAQCARLEEITLPESVEYMGPYAFTGCTSLKRVDLSCRIREIPYRCFITDSSLESIILPPELAVVDRGAFSGCTSLKSVRTAGETSSEYDVIFPSTLERLGGEAFTNCKSIRSVSLQNSPAVVEDRVFTCCSSLQKFAAEGVVKYKAYCFQGCFSLKEVTFGPQTRNLGKDLFLGARDHMYRDPEDQMTVRFSCAPDFTCAADSLPEKAVYEVDAVAWLKNGRPYQCKPLFKACVRNIARGEKVPEEQYREMLRILKRNRKNLYEWFLSDVDVMRLVTQENIPDCTDCVVMWKLLSRRQLMSFHPMVKVLRSYMFRFSKEQTDKAWEKLYAAERAEEEKAKEESRLLAEELKQEEKVNPSAMIPALEKICLEELDLSVRAYNCLKRRGINTLADLAVLSQEDLMKIPNMGRRSMEEILRKLEDMTGIRLPEEREDEPENGREDPDPELSDTDN